MSRRRRGWPRSSRAPAAARRRRRWSRHAMALHRAQAPFVSATTSGTRTACASSRTRSAPRRGRRAPYVELARFLIEEANLAYRGEDVEPRHGPQPFRWQHSRQAELRRAVAVCDEALAAQPGHIGAQTVKAIALVRLGDEATAEQIVEPRARGRAAEPGSAPAAGEVPGGAGERDVRAGRRAPLAARRDQLVHRDPLRRRLPRDPDDLPRAHRRRPGAGRAARGPGRGADARLAGRARRRARGAQGHVRGRHAPGRGGLRGGPSRGGLRRSPERAPTAAALARGQPDPGRVLPAARARGRLRPADVRDHEPGAHQRGVAAAHGLAQGDGGRRAGRARRAGGRAASRSRPTRASGLSRRRCSPGRARPPRRPPRTGWRSRSSRRGSRWTRARRAPRCPARRRRSWPS